MKNKIVSGIIIGLISGIFFFLVFGGVASVFSNPFFTRMTPVGFLEWFTLISTSILLGSFIGLHYYIKKNNLGKCNILATGGGILGFLTFGCSICNKILVLVLGVTGVLTYFDPLRPILGALSIAFLLYANFSLIKIIKK